MQVFPILLLALQAYWIIPLAPVSQLDLVLLP
jgi:hypothetical protein